MSGLQHARSFRDLIVYRKTRAVAKRIFEATKSFPREEMYSLCGDPPIAVRESAGDYFTDH